jgi:hypothetical protein
MFRERLLAATKHVTVTHTAWPGSPGAKARVEAPYV